MKYKLIINHIEKKDFNSKNLLFLNPLIPKANLLQKKKFKIVDNIWKKRDTLYSDSRYVNKLTNLHLKDLKNFLNKYHNKNYSFKFWKIHLEVWLLYFITINYLSWKTLKLAFKNNKIGEVLLYLDTRDSSVNTFDDFFRLTIDLSWRGQMYKKILKNFQKKNKFLLIEKKKKIFFKYKKFNRSTILNFLIKYFSKFLKAIKKNKMKYVFFYNGFSNKTLNNIFEILKNKYRIINIPNYIPSKNLKDQVFRKKIKLKYSNDFEKYISKQIVENLPLIYLENFKDHKKFLKQFYLPESEQIITSSGVHHYSNFTRYIAESVEKGSKLNIVQHGGCYGQYKLHTLGDREYELSDSFFSWGWQYKKKIIPIGVNKNFKKFQKNNFYDKKNIYLEVRVRHPYVFRIDSSAGVYSINKYLENLINFLEIIRKKSINQNLFVRLHARQLGCNEKKIFSNISKDIKFANSFTSIDNLKESSKIFIHTSLSTGHLLSLAQNLPIIIFCDPKFEEFKDQKIIINLKKNQILFDNPHKAIKRLIDLDKDISLWWKDKNLQKFIKEYTDEFAKLNKNYDKDFCNYLEKN